MNRNPSIELLRIVLMLGICCLHANNVAPNDPFYWTNYIFAAFVDVFVFISGYYGVKFRISKIISLYAIGIYCCVVGYGVANFVILKSVPFSIEAWYSGTTDVFVNKCWFLHAYAFMMFWAPLVNYAIDACWRNAVFRDAVRFIMPIIFCMSVWSWLRTAPIAHRIPIPMTHGMEEFSGVTLLLVYLIARLCRICSIPERLPIWWIVGSLAILPVAVAYGFGGYHSITVILMSLSIFTVFIRYGGWVLNFRFLGKVYSIFCPSLFAIYLMHVHQGGYDVMRLAGGGLVVGCGVFLFCFVLDIPRRFMIVIFRPIIKWVLDRIDYCYLRVENCFANLAHEG